MLVRPCASPTPRAPRHARARAPPVRPRRRHRISITLLHPTPQNFRIRFFAFLASRLCATFIALDIARQIESPYTLAVFVTMVAAATVAAAHASDPARTLPTRCPTGDPCSA